MYKTYLQLTPAEALQVGSVIDLASADPWDFVYFVDGGVVVYAKSAQQVTS